MLIQTPEISRKLQQGLRLTGLPDAVLAPEIVGVILLEDYSRNPGDIARGCMGATRRAPVAAEFSMMALVRVGDPPTYDLLATECHFSTDTDQIITLDIPTAELTGMATTTGTSFTDLGITGRPTSQVQTDTKAAIPGSRTIRRYSVLANTTYRVPLDIRIGSIGIAGGLNSIVMVCQTANTALVGGFNWTEASPLG